MAGQQRKASGYDSSGNSPQNEENNRILDDQCGGDGEEIIDALPPSSDSSLVVGVVQVKRKKWLNLQRKLLEKLVYQDQGSSDFSTPSTNQAESGLPGGAGCRWMQTMCLIAEGKA